MKPTTLFTLDEQDMRIYSPAQQAQLAVDITFLFQLEDLIALHEQQLQAGTPDPPDEAMDYGKVEALIKVLQQKNNHIITVSAKTNYHYYQRKTALRVVLLAFVSVAILWFIWEIVAWLHSVL